MLRKILVGSAVAGLLALGAGTASAHAHRRHLEV